MCLITELNVETQELQSNAIKAAYYLFDALRDGDYETSNLEMEELQFLMRRIEENKQKRERFQALTDVVAEMRARGIQIDLANRSSFLKTNAKNAVEKYQKTANLHVINKKRQQA